MSAEIGIHYLTNLSYLAIPVLLMLGCIGVVPLTEEAILLIAGYFAFEGYLNLYVAMLVAFVSVILVENIFFYFGSHGNYFFRRFVNGRTKKFAERQIEKRGTVAVFMARFIPGMRVLMPWVAATSGMPWRKFFFANALGALIQAPLIVCIGHWLGAHIEKGLAFVFSVDEVIPLLLLILFVSAAIIICLKRKAVRNTVFGGANGRI
ncbi:MAG: DedA family protein [Candidatus Woesearchaeota archaeon]